MSQLGWVDFSPKHREKLMTLLDLLKDSGVVDELGIGVIRDSIADELFPGISTIQTRAKYFIIIPSIIQDYLLLTPSEKRKILLRKYLEEQENEIMWTLAEKYNHQEGLGVIGITKRRKETLARRASSIYWNGIRTFKLIDTNLSLSEFLDSERTHKDQLIKALSDDNYSDDKDVDIDERYKISIPYEIDWKQDLDLPLSYDEADYLKHTIIDNAKDSLIAYLLQNEKLLDVFLKSSDFLSFCKQAHSTLPDKLQKKVILSHDFSVLSHNIHLIYNGFLQKLHFKNDNFLNDWLGDVRDLKSDMINFEGFDLELLFEISIRADDARTFIEDYWREINKKNREFDKIRNTIVSRELANKGNRAKLHDKYQPDFKNGDKIGLDYLDYRFGNVKTILNDINIGLNQ